MKNFNENSKEFLMLPSEIPEKVFDTIFIQSHTLLNAMEHKLEATLELTELSDLVVNILKNYNIFELYKDNIGALVVMYASWIILESLRRSNTIKLKVCTFETLFDNEVLMKTLENHRKAFEKTIQTIVVS